MAALPDADDNLRGDLANAFKEVAAREETPEAPVVEAPQTPEAPEAPETERPRDESGKFVKGTLTLKPKPADAAASPAASVGAGAEPQQPAPAAPPRVELPAPTDWLGEHKLLWKNVPNALKQKYVDDIKAARAEAQQSVPLMEAIGKDRDMLIREGQGSVEGGVKRLLELSNFALADPVNFVRTFVQQRGLNPQAIFGQGQPVPQGQAPNPQLPVEFTALQQRLDAFEAAQQQQAHSAKLALIESFASDPEHVYFNDVSDDMLAFVQAMPRERLQSDPQGALKEAYDRAVWANPATRAQLLASQTPTDTAAVEAARRAKAASLNGSPVPGASSQDGSPDEDLRTTLERNYKAAAGGQRV